jgi:hypothetical protein
VTVVGVEARLNDRYGWIGVPLVIDGTFRLLFLVSALRGSVVSSEALTTLPAYFREVAPGRYVMHRARLGAEPLVDLELQVSRQIARVQADGALGQDFLRRFTDVNLNIPNMTLTFTSL